MRFALAVVSVLVACGQPTRSNEPRLVEPAAVTAAPVPPADIVIGQFATLTGSEAIFGIPVDQGVQLAIAQRNAAGGIRGAKLRLVTYDDAGKASEASTAVTRLIHEDGAQAILGGVASTLTLAAGEVAQAAGVPMVVAAATNPMITEDYDVAFRVCLLDDFIGYAAARFARDTMQAARAVMLIEDGSDYSRGLARSFATSFTDLGGAIVGEHTYQRDTIDAKTFKAMARADVIFVPGYYTDVGRIAAAVRAAGIKTPFLGGDGWDSSELDTASLDGSHYVTQFSPQVDRDVVASFVRAYTERYGTQPDTLAALGYDAAMLLLDAIDRAPTDLRDALQATIDFEGVTGTLSIDASRNARKTAVVIAVQGGAAIFAGSIAPP